MAHYSKELRKYCNDCGNVTQVVKGQDVKGYQAVIVLLVGATILLALEHFRFH